MNTTKLLIVAPLPQKQLPDYLKEKKLHLKTLDFQMLISYMALYLAHNNHQRCNYPQDKIQFIQISSEKC